MKFAEVISMKLRQEKERDLSSLRSLEWDKLKQVKCQRDKEGEEKRDLMRKLKRFKNLAESS